MATATAPTAWLAIMTVDEQSAQGDEGSAVESPVATPSEMDRVQRHTADLVTIAYDTPGRSGRAGGLSRLDVDVDVVLASHECAQQRI